MRPKLIELQGKIMKEKYKKISKNTYIKNKIML